MGTRAMLDAMAGAAMRPDPLIAALFGAAAALEILHPDAWVAKKTGPQPTPLTRRGCGGANRGPARGTPSPGH